MTESSPPPRPPRRVALALLRYFPHGGLQRIALAVAETLVARGHSVTLFVGDWRGPRPEGEGQGGHLHVVVLNAGGATNHGRARRFAARLAERTGRGDFDVVLGFDRLPGLDLYFAGDPCYSARLRRDRSPIHRWTPRARAFLALERAVFGPASTTRTLLMNPKEREVIEAEYPCPVGQERGGGRFVVLPPGYSASRRPGPRAAEDRVRIRGELGVRDGDLLLLALGSDFHRKGFDRAVRALGQRGDGEPASARVLAVAGAGDSTRLEALARDLGILDALRLLGPRDDVPALLQGADALIHPCRSEPAGMVLLEALSAGRPVITSAVAGYAEHVAASGAGFVLPEPFDGGRLAAALDRITPDSLPGLEERALAYAAVLRPEAMFEAVADEVEEAARS